MLKGYILLELTDGKTYKYVRDVVKQGDNKNFYTYGDTSGDTYAFTGDTPGRIKYDFTTLRSAYLSRKSGAFNTYMLWPESTGDTEILTRANLNSTSPARISRDGDTFFRILKPMNRVSIDASKIISISVVEEKITDWYSSAGNLGRDM